MTPGARLAAYLADELDADERQALEAELARDPGLRAQLADIRRTDELLAALPEVAPRPAFSGELRDRLRTELRRDGADELSQRRRRRDRARWVPLGAAAAAIVTIAGIGLGMGVLGGADDAGMETAGQDGEAGATMMESAPVGDDQPIVVALDGSYTADDLAEVADEAAIQAVAGRGLDELAAADVAAEYSARFGAGSAQLDAMTGTAAADSAATETAEEERAATAEGGGFSADLRVLGDAMPEDLAAVQACLPQLLSDAGTVIPVYAELATFEGEPAIVYGLVSRDPETGRFTRVEVWAVGRRDCQVRRFVQP